MCSSNIIIIWYTPRWIVRLTLDDLMMHTRAGPILAIADRQMQRNGGGAQTRPDREAQSKEEGCEGGSRSIDRHGQGVHVADKLRN